MGLNTTSTIMMVRPVQFRLNEQTAVNNYYQKALEGVNNIGYSLYFNNSPFRSKPNDLIKIIDGEYFYY